MSRRSRARQVVLQILYQDDLNRDADTEATETLLRSRLDADPELVAMAGSLLSGVRRNRDALDRLLAQTAEHWSLDRMAVIDRNVLRLGAYEMFYTETPDRVAVDEAIELAKRFGGRDSGQFVNGILDRLLPRKRGGGERVSGE